LAHKLGLPGPERGENTPPVIVQPVFLRGDDGQIAPYKMVWPSYWGRLKDGKVTPILPEEAAKSGKLPAQPSTDVARDPYNSKPLSQPQIQAALESFSGDKSKGDVVFVAAGKLYRLESGKLKSEEHQAAKPYTWALGHDVRPANQALGARGCADCHSTDSPMYFATIQARGPVEPGSSLSKATWDLRGDSKLLASTFASSFIFRPMLKCLSFGSAFIVLGVLLNYGLLGLNAITSQNRGSKKASPPQE
jgi:hypothetical protein